MKPKGTKVKSGGRGTKTGGNDKGKGRGLRRPPPPPVESPSESDGSCSPAVSPSVSSRRLSSKRGSGNREMTKRSDRRGRFSDRNNDVDHDSDNDFGSIGNNNFYMSKEPPARSNNELKYDRSDRQIDPPDEKQLPMSYAPTESILSRSRSRSTTRTKNSDTTNLNERSRGSNFSVGSRGRKDGTNNNSGSKGQGKQKLSDRYRSEIQSDYSNNSSSESTSPDPPKTRKMSLRDIMRQQAKHSDEGNIQSKCRSRTHGTNGKHPITKKNNTKYENSARRAPNPPTSPNKNFLYNYLNSDTDDQLLDSEIEQYEQFQEEQYQQRQQQCQDDSEQYDCEQQQQGDSSMHRQFNLTPLYDLEMASLDSKSKSKQKKKQYQSNRKGKEFGHRQNNDYHDEDESDSDSDDDNGSGVECMKSHEEYYNLSGGGNGRKSNGRNRNDNLIYSDYDDEDLENVSLTLNGGHDYDNVNDFDDDDDDEERPLRESRHRSKRKPKNPPSAKSQAKFFLSRSEYCLNRMILTTFVLVSLIFIRDHTPWWKEHKRRAALQEHHHHHRDGTDDDTVVADGEATRIDPMAVYNTNDDDSTHTKDHDPLHKYNEFSAGERISGRPAHKSLNHGFMDESYENRPPPKNSASTAMTVEVRNEGPDEETSAFLESVMRTPGKNEESGGSSSTHKILPPPPPPPSDPAGAETQFQDSSSYIEKQPDQQQKSSFQQQETPMQQNLDNQVTQQQQQQVITPSVQEVGNQIQQQQTSPPQPSFSSLTHDFEASTGSSSLDGAVSLSGNDPQQTSHSSEYSSPIVSPYDPGVESSSAAIGNNNSEGAATNQADQVHGSLQSSHVAGGSSYSDSANADTNSNVQAADSFFGNSLADSNNSNGNTITSGSDMYEINPRPNIGMSSFNGNGLATTNSVNINDRGDGGSQSEPMNPSFQSSSSFSFSAGNEDNSQAEKVHSIDGDNAAPSTIENVEKISSYPPDVGGLELFDDGFIQEVESVKEDLNYANANEQQQLSLPSASGYDQRASSGSGSDDHHDTNVAKSMDSIDISPNGSNTEGLASSTANERSSNYEHPLTSNLQSSTNSQNTNMSYSPATNENEMSPIPTNQNVPPQQATQSLSTVNQPMGSQAMSGEAFLSNSLSVQSADHVKEVYKESYYRWNHSFRPGDNSGSDSGKDVPVFWRIPRSASGMVEQVLSYCFGLTLANALGTTMGHDRDERLGVITVGAGGQYVNVDMSTPAGIQRAKVLGLGSSGLADVISTPFIYETADVFQGIPESGKCFTLLRHPVDRAISLYHLYQKDESGNPNTAQYRGLTLDEFAEKVLENNWMVRFLTGKRSGSLSWHDLEAAKEVFGRKCLVGLVEEAELSLHRYEHFFNWNSKVANSAAKNECVRNNLVNADKRREHPTYEGTQAWEVLRKKNEYDVLLYEYAKALFDQQSAIFEKLL